MELHIKKKYKSEEEIHNIAEWEEAFFPGKSKLWKDGRSAKCLAEYLLNCSPDCPSELKEILGEDSNEETIYCYPEHVTSFPTGTLGKGRGRNHDLMIETPHRIITIEAKTDESFDKQMKELAIDSDNKELRYYNTYKALFGEISPKSEIRYQLVQATVATILEAEKCKKSKASLVVITFKKAGTKYDQEALDRNVNDYDKFKEKLDNSEAFSELCAQHKVTEFELKHIHVDL